MARASHVRLGVHNNWALLENAARLSMSCPVTSFTVNPSRFTCANETPRFSVSLMTGPDAPPRTAHDPWVAKGADSVPTHRVADGRLLVMVTRPPSVLRPKSALCGPRTNSI